MDFTSTIKVQANFHQMLTWFLSEKSVYVEREEPWNIPVFSQNISHSYKTLPIISDNLKETTIKLSQLIVEEYKQGDRGYIEPIARLRAYIERHLKGYLCDFLVHGSFATLDYSVGWSDLDTLVVIKDKTLNDPCALVEFRKKIIDAHDYLMQLDPHQHHGFIFCTEFGLSQYFSHFIPLEVISRSKSLISDGEITLKHDRRTEAAILSFKEKNVLLYSAYQKKILLHHKYNNEYLHENFENINAMYQLKYFLSLVMTLPAYYLDAKGDSCYKKESFEIVREQFQNEWGIVERASKIRVDWPSRESHPYVINTIPNWVMESLGPDYFFHAYKLSSKMMMSLMVDEKCL
jgi:hypothetical protein